MCYSTCPNQRSDGQCRLRFPTCEQDDIDNSLDDLADRLYNEWQDGERSELSARLAYKRAVYNTGARK